MLEFFGTYYGSLRGGIENIFELSVSINPLENDDVYEGRDYIDNSNFMEDTDKDMADSTIFGRDIDNTPIERLRQIQSSIERCLLAIENYKKMSEKEQWEVVFYLYNNCNQ
jgi:hypothetical protein